MATDSGTSSDQKIMLQFVDLLQTNMNSDAPSTYNALTFS